MNEALRVGVVGVGHFGRHHARVFSKLDGVKLVGVADIDGGRARAVGGEYAADAFSSHRDLFGKVDAVSVAVPTRSHASVACDFLKQGVAVLVEKPMAATLAEALGMQAAAEESGAKLQVGHIMRFSPVVMAMREMDVEPKFLEVHRLSPFSFRSLDVGVVLDMMIHDIDLVLQLARGRLEKIDAVAFALLGPTEDICNARMAFDDGCVANLTASRVALKTMRKVRIFSENSYISMDFVQENGVIIEKSPKFSPEAFDIEKMKRLSTDELKEVMLDGFFSVREMKLDEGEPLTAELQSFVDCVSNGREPLVSGEDGIRSMEAAEKILASVDSHDWYR